MQTGPGRGDQEPTTANDDVIANDAAQQDDGGSNDIDLEITAFHPTYAEGPTKSTLEKFNTGIEGDAIPLPGGSSLEPKNRLEQAEGAGEEAADPQHARGRDAAGRRVEAGGEQQHGRRSAADLSLRACGEMGWRWIGVDAGFHVRMYIGAVTVAGILVFRKDTGAVCFAPGSGLIRQSLIQQF